MAPFPKRCRPSYGNPCNDEVRRFTEHLDFWLRSIFDAKYEGKWGKAGKAQIYGRKCNVENQKRIEYLSKIRDFWLRSTIFWSSEVLTWLIIHAIFEGKWGKIQIYGTKCAKSNENWILRIGTFD